MRISTVVAIPAMCFGLALLLPSAAGAESCGSAEGPQAFVFFIHGIPDAPTGHIVVRIDATGDITAAGTVQTQEGQSRRVVTDKGFGFVEMSCDIDEHGLLQVTALQLSVHDVGVDESLPLSIVPNDGAIGEDDFEPITLIIGNTTFVQTASVLFAP